MKTSCLGGVWPSQSDLAQRARGKLMEERVSRERVKSSSTKQQFGRLINKEFGSASSPMLERLSATFCPNWLYFAPAGGTIQILPMVGNVDIKVRPLKLAYLVDPNKKEQVREAIRLSSTLWGGVYFPLIPLYKRTPRSWKDPVKAPEAQKVILGYLDAFDPDILVQFSKSVPDFVTNLGLEVIKPTDIWGGLGQEGNLSSKFGIGIFEP
jgi:hypothetical protein